jgi:hypothetical protein
VRKRRVEYVSALGTDSGMCFSREKRAHQHGDVETATKGLAEVVMSCKAVSNRTCLI